MKFRCELLPERVWEGERGKKREKEKKVAPPFRSSLGGGVGGGGGGGCLKLCFQFPYIREGGGKKKGET